MSVDYSVLLYDPVYTELGVDAVLTAAGTAGEVTITVIDETRRKTMTSGGVELRSVDPSACARIPELAELGIDRADYQGSVLSFNGRTWVVRSYDLLGSPNGEDFGLVRFKLNSVEST
jgi:hypothetical protein